MTDWVRDWDRDGEDWDCGSSVLEERRGAEKMIRSLRKGQANWIVSGLHSFPRVLERSRALIWVNRCKVQKDTCAAGSRLTLSFPKRDSRPSWSVIRMATEDIDMDQIYMILSKVDHETSCHSFAARARCVYSHPRHTPSLERFDRNWLIAGDLVDFDHSSTHTDTNDRLTIRHDQSHSPSSNRVYRSGQMAPDDFVI